MNRIVRLAMFASVWVAAAAHAQSLTGNWSGTYSYSIQVAACQNKTFTSTGNATATLLQTGTAIFGRIDFSDVMILGTTCTPMLAHVTSAIIGRVDGTAISLTFPNDSASTAIVGTASANAITMTLSDAFAATGTLNLTRDSGNAPSVDVTGLWSGNYNFTDRCGAASLSYSDTFSMALTQTGSTASGVVTMANVPLYDSNCRKLTSINMSLAAAGVVSGSTFTGAVWDPSGSFDFPISVAVTASMSGTVAGASATSTSGTFTLSRSSANPPVSTFSGSYEGTYSETDDERNFCLNLASLKFDGTASMAIVQAGSAITGAVTLHDTLDVFGSPFGTCSVVEGGDDVLPLYGTLTPAGQVTLVLPLGGGATQTFTATFANDKLTATATDSFGDVLTFQGTKSAGIAAPKINAFSASPTVILNGQTATLTWSVADVASVTIDNGVGTQPAAGSVVVSPHQTTVYTLTATNATGSVTAKAVVNVASAIPRRRASPR